MVRVMIVVGVGDGELIRNCGGGEGADGIVPVIAIAFYIIKRVLTLFKIKPATRN